MAVPGSSPASLQWCGGGRVWSEADGSSSRDRQQTPRHPALRHSHSQHSSKGQQHSLQSGKVNIVIRRLRGMLKLAKLNYLYIKFEDGISKFNVIGYILQCLGR